MDMDWVKFSYRRCLNKLYRNDPMKKLDKEFFKRDTLIVAEELLGKTLVRNIEGHNTTRFFKDSGSSAQ